MLIHHQFNPQEQTSLEFDPNKVTFIEENPFQNVIHFVDTPMY